MRVTRTVVHSARPLLKEPVDAGMSLPPALFWLSRDGGGRSTIRLNGCDEGNRSGVVLYPGALERFRRRRDFVS